MEIHSIMERYIPPEITINILSRLPVKSLLRFQRVSKSWRRFISRFALPDPRQRLVILHGSWLTRFNIADPREETISVISPSPGSSYILPNFYGRRGSLHLLASYKGLVVFSHNSHVYLLNPCTKQVRSLLALVSSRCRFVAGICYDSTTDDHKVLIGTTCDETRINNDSTRDCLKVQVTSLKTKRYFRDIEFPYQLNWDSMKPVVDEKIHWLVSRDQDPMDRSSLSSQMILSFDVIGEKFMEVPMYIESQYRGYEHRYLIHGLGVLDGCLALTTYDSLPHPSPWRKGSTHVWVMKEYGVKESWTLLFALKDQYMPSPIFHPLFMMKNGEMLMSVREYGMTYNLKKDSFEEVHVGERIMAYNPKEDSCRFICLPDNTPIKSVVAYEESLFFPPCLMEDEEEYEKAT